MAMHKDRDPFARDRITPQVLTPNGPIRAGDRVRLMPSARADILDVALAGKTATIQAIEEDLENHLYVAVVLDDDPGKDFGHMRLPGHCFFFRPEEVQRLDDNKRGTL